jgi:hypothetical protein
MSIADMTKSHAGIACSGWWQEVGFGRQPMQELYLRFDAGRISGSGRDIVGAFTFFGAIDEQGRVVMKKKYLGQHTVDYEGTYDGEGLMWGEWRIGPAKNRWMIRFSRARPAPPKEAAILEFA